MGLLFGLVAFTLAATMVAVLIAGGNRAPFGAGAPETTAPAVDVPETAPPASVFGELEERADEVSTPVVEPPAIETPAPRDNLIEPSALVTNGVLTLSGAQPSADDAESLAVAAREIFGEENVVNNYVVDDRADATRLGKLEVYDTLHFVDPSGNEADEESVRLLEVALLSLNTNPDQTLTIIAHTNDRENIISSLVRSQERAEELTEFFAGRGIDADRIIAIGRGSSEPMMDNALERGQRVNERAVLLLS